MTVDNDNVFAGIPKGFLVCEIALERAPASVPPVCPKQIERTWHYMGMYYIGREKPMVKEGVGSFVFVEVMKNSRTRNTCNVRICARTVVGGETKLFYMASRDIKWKEKLSSVCILKDGFMDVMKSCLNK